MTLSEYAKNNKITYRTAWNHFKLGKIKNVKTDSTGHIIIENQMNEDWAQIK